MKNILSAFCLLAMAGFSSCRGRFEVEVYDNFGNPLLDITITIKIPNTKPFQIRIVKTKLIIRRAKLDY